MNDLTVDQKPGISEEEEDKPLFSTVTSSEREVPAHSVDEIEQSLKIAKGWQTLLLKDKGFKLLIICIIIAAGTYIADCILINVGMKSSSLMTGFFELLKFVISILLGYVFAKATDS